MEAHRSLFKNTCYCGRFSPNAFFSENCFETLQVFRFNKIGLLILEQLMPHQLVRHLKGDIITFWQRPSSKALEYTTNMKEYELVHAALSSSGTRSQMAVNYFKGVSPMLTIVSAVRETNAKAYFLHFITTALPVIINYMYFSVISQKITQSL